MGEWWPAAGARRHDVRLMVFKLVTAASKTWRKLKDENQLPKVVRGVIVTNGVEVSDRRAQGVA